MNLPNRITVTRLLIVPIFILLYLLPYESLGISIPVYHILYTQVSLIDLLLVVIFIIASITDYLDGHLARKNNLVTTFGKFADPIADKMIINSALILLCYDHRIHVLVILIMILRDTIVDAVRLVAASNNRVIAASFFGKLKTTVQMIGICLVLLNNPFFAYFNIPFDNIVLYIATAISFLSGVDYFMKSQKDILETM